MRVYKVNEMFYSLQAEGFNAGRAAVFVRLAGCNLTCPFCDTDHDPFSAMTAEDIEREVDRLDPTRRAMVVFTGGEPTLQLDDEEELCNGRFRAVETNGIPACPSWVEWVTVSPKTKLSAERLAEADEVKVLQGWFDDDELRRIEDAAGRDAMLYIQPTARRDGTFDALPAVEFVKRNPEWRLSLQFHKMINIR